MSNRVVLLLVILSGLIGVYFGYNLCKHLNRPPTQVLELSAATDCADEADLMIRVMEYLNTSPNSDDTQWIANKLQQQLDSFPGRCIEVNITQETLDGVCTTRPDNDWCIVMTK